MEEGAVLGKRIPRREGAEKAIGRTIFSTDVALPGMLYGKILWSTRPHARLLEVDAGAAEALRGVVAVITGSELEEPRYGILIQDKSSLAREKVRYIGEAVAAVAATAPEIAAEAVGLIRVRYEDLPAVFDPVEAMKPTSPIIHDELPSYGCTRPELLGERRGNVCSHVVSRAGNIDEGFAGADHIVEDCFVIPSIQHAFVEPHAVTAEVDASGKVTIYTACQGTFLVRSELARILGLPLTKVRVVPTEVGGAFGGKIYPLIEPICAHLALKTRRPVHIVLSMEEVCTAGRRARSAVIEMKSGVSRDGLLLARQARLVFDTGGYADWGPGTTMIATLYAAGPYRVPHVLLEGYCVYTNRAALTSFRAPGLPSTAFAFESHMDHIAQELGIDPLEIRKRNTVRAGDFHPVAGRLEKSSASAVLQAAADAIEWGKPTASPHRGKGLALSAWHTRGAPSSGVVKVNEDGTVAVLTGAVDLTGSNTIFAQIVAEELGIPLEDVTVVTGDTDAAPNAPLTGGSMIAYNMGSAVLRAARDAKGQLFALAAELLGADASALVAEDRMVYVKGVPGRGLSLAELSQASQTSRGGYIVGKGSGPVLPAHETFVAQAVEVEVDPETGEVTVLRMVTAQDVGSALNTDTLEGQMQGAVSQGVGLGLFEEMVFGRGQVLNPSFRDYLIPTALDMPPVETIIVEDPSPHGPYGARGMGEAPAIPGAAAIANAVACAVGVRVVDLPITPEKIVRALKGW